MRFPNKIHKANGVINCQNINTVTKAYINQMTWMIEIKNKLPRVLSCFFEDFKHLKAYLSAGSIATWISTKGSTENSI